jgi:hypothetical protein
MMTISVMELVDAAEQQVVDGVERRLAAVGRDRRESRARMLGPDVVVEQDDADQSRTALRIERWSRIASRFAGRAGSRRARRARRRAPTAAGGVEVREAEGARVHVERDVLAPSRVPRPTSSMQRRLSSSPFARDEMGDLSRSLRGRPCESPRRPPRPRRRRASRVGRVERCEARERRDLLLSGACSCAYSRPVE